MVSKFGGLLGGRGPDAGSSGDKRNEVARISGTKPPATTSLHRSPLPRVGGIPAFAIALDATGSMASSIDDARVHIGEILDRVRKLLGRPIQVQFLCYRDYDVFDPSNQVKAELLEVSPMTEDAQALSAWLAKITAYGGGSNSGEAIEAALESVHRTMTNQVARFAAILLVGDEPSNPRADLDAANRAQVMTAHHWAKRFGEHKVPIHSFVVRSQRAAIDDFEEIARLSGGKTGRLDGSESMLNMAALAMVAAVGGGEAVRRYAEQHRLSAPEKAFALLLTGPSS